MEAFESVFQNFSERSRKISFLNDCGTAIIGDLSASTSLKLLNQCKR